MDMSLGRRTASGILFTASGLSVAILETNTGERNHDRRRRPADTNSSCKTCKRVARIPEESTAVNVGECAPRKSKNQPRKVDGGARRKLPRNSEAPVPWEDDEDHWYIDDDPYRDMRMDIDDMSYEELLDLGERIGTVSTAMSEEDLSRCLTRSEYTSGDHSATCSICQEGFVEGDQLGEVACRHIYHATCIEQWLKSKNWCPLCKSSASQRKVSTDIN